MGTKLLQSCPTLCLWTVALQVSLSMGFSGQEYSSGLPCPPPGDLPDTGTAPVSLMSPALAVRKASSILGPFNKLLFLFLIPLVSTKSLVLFC